MDRYDIIVIGAGAGGLTAGFTAAGLGKKVLLIDKDKPGGECTWSGCIPSKALINEAKKVHIVKNRVKDYKYDSKEALDYVHTVRKRVYSHETPRELSKAGIEYLKGEAVFIDSKTVRVGERELTAKKYIISTGSSPLIPNIDGLESVDYLTNESIFELERLPDSLIILGGGPIGVELAQAINRLGTKVKLVEMMPTLIFREEVEMALAIGKRLADEGVELHLNAKAKNVSKDGQISLIYEKEGVETSINADSLLVAVGRRPNMGVGLDAAGVKYSSKGIEVNSYLQTSKSHIYAVGDVAGPYQFSHMANAQGIQATQNAILPFKRKISYEHVAWVTFTQPEIARAGMTEKEAKDLYGDSVRVYEHDFNRLDRAITDGSTMETMKVVLNRRGKVLGISILADRAGELIGEAQLIKSTRQNFAKMGSVVHPYPTYSEVFSKIGKKVMVDNLLNNPIVKLFRK